MKKHSCFYFKIEKKKVGEKKGGTCLREQILNEPPNVVIITLKAETYKHKSRKGIIIAFLCIALVSNQ